MKTITISVSFNISGHAAINVIPTNYNQWTPSQSSSNDYNLSTGTYSITYFTATQAGGTIEVTEGGAVLASFPLSVGVDGGNFDIVIV